MTQMTGTAQTVTGAAFTLAHLEEDNYLQLIEWSKTELEALEAGMYNQTAPSRTLSSAMWAAQMQAQQDIVQQALAQGVPADAITAITHRNPFDAS